MNFFKRRVPVPAPQSSPPPEEPKAGDTAPGVRMLKDVWHIEAPKKAREVADGAVSHDIYNTPVRSGGIPPRHHGRAGED